MIVAKLQPSVTDEVVHLITRSFESSEKILALE